MALAFKRHLGIAYLSAWHVKHKLLQMMKVREDQTPLNGAIEVDDAYWDGERQGAKPGCGLPHKVPFRSALLQGRSPPGGLCLGQGSGFRKTGVALRQMPLLPQRHRAN